MTEAGSGDHTPTKAGDKLPRAHKRCVNKNCREILTLATKYCKKCNAVQFERRPPQKSKSGGGKREAPEDAASSASEEGSDEVEVKSEEEGESAGREEEEDGDVDDDDDEEEEDAKGHAAPANIPQATNFAIQQAHETCDQEPFDCRTGPDRPMVELVAGSRQYYQASIVRESKTEVRLLFPATRRMPERIEWVDKRSSRIWRGRMEMPFWRYIKGKEGAWEPKSLGDAGASFRRRGSGKSRSAGATRSRGTKPSTEDGTESADLRKAGAALDTAASPKPRPLKRPPRDRQQLGRKRPRDEGSDASSAGSDAEQRGSGGSGAPRDVHQQDSGALDSSEQGQQRGAAGGGATAAGGDPLEAWFQAHYALLKANGLMGAGFSPASAETGRPSANGTQRRRGRQQPRAQQQRGGGGGAQRSRDQRQQQRHAASHSTEDDTSEDEGPAVAGGGSGGRHGPKGGRELARLQMWAWERRGRGSSSEEGSDDSEDSADEGSAKQQAPDAAQQPRPKPEERAAAEATAGAAGAAAAAKQPAVAGAAAQQQAGRQQGAEPAGSSPTAAAAKIPDARSAPGSAEGKQPRGGKPAPASGRSEQRQGGPAPAAAAQQAGHPKPRPPVKPLVVLEECDVFGRVDTIRRQQSGMPPPPTSPRAGAGSSFGKPASAASGPSPPLPKAPSDASARAAGGAGAAAAPPPASQDQQQPQQAATNGGGGGAQLPAGAAPAVATAEPAKPLLLSPLKRKMLGGSVLGWRWCRCLFFGQILVCLPLKRAPPQQKQCALACTRRFAAALPCTAAMRRKKHKHTRRALRFYRISFGFRPPYKVLLDGNFVHALDQMKKGESKDLIARLLGDQVKCYTTPCVQHELKKLGKEVAGARQLLKRYPLHKCGHEEHCSAADCLLAQLGDKNEEHFFVATQDKSLQRKCMAVPGGAVLFASVNGVHMEQPSALQKQTVAQEEQKHMAPSEAELQTAALQEVAAARQLRDKPPLRRKRAKGPNPLSALPKKKKKAAVGGGGEQQQTQQAAGGGGEGEQQAGKRKRQRRRGGRATGGGAEGNSE